MSDLQLALLAIGAALVVAVFVYNKWQEARYRKLAENGLKSRPSDVLLRSSARPEPVTEEPRVEPTWSAGADGEAAPPAGVEPVPAESVAAAQTGALSEVIDFIVPLETPAAVAGPVVLASAAGLAPFGSRVKLEGLGPQGWTSVLADGSYTRMRAGLQLVNRRGAVRAEELQAFCEALNALAAKLEAKAVPPAAETALATAATLDRFCEQVDIQMAVHVVSTESAFAGTKIRALAEASGLRLERDGRFHHRDEEGRESFILANEEPAAFSLQAMKQMSTSALLLELDVPRAPGGSEALARFRLFAEQLAGALAGRLVDDNRAPLDAAAFQAITGQLKSVYQTMQAQGIPPGSALALRLFS